MLRDLHTAGTSQPAMVSKDTFREFVLYDADDPCLSMAVSFSAVRQASVLADVVYLHWLLSLPLTIFQSNARPVRSFSGRTEFLRRGRAVARGFTGKARKGTRTGGLLLHTHAAPGRRACMVLHLFQQKARQRKHDYARANHHSSETT